MKVYCNEEIKIEGNVNVRQLSKFSMKEQINEHMFFSFTGSISAEDVEEYKKMHLLGQIVRIYAHPGEEEELLCCGIITEAKITITDRIYMISANGASNSQSLDRKKIKRSFQGTDRTYREIIKEISKGAEVLYRYPKEERLDAPVIQYEETDWELLKRLAGRLHTVIIPNVLSETCQAFFGLQSGRIHNISNSKIIAMGKMEISFSTSEITNLQLGDKIQLEKRIGTVIKKQADYAQNDLLEIQYTIGVLTDWELILVDNYRLRGTAIRGRVLKAKDEYLKLWLEIDESQKESEAFWYPYLPETGNLMYTMPEQGAEAVLYFPDGKEKHGIVIHCFPDEIKKAKNLDHRIKKMQTPDSKLVAFDPDRIEFSGEKDEDVNMINLDERAGIILLSSQTVRIIADKEIHIQSGLSCAVTAQNEISVLQTGGKNSVEMSGNQIRFQAEKYHTAAIAHKSKKTDFQYDDEKGGQSYSMLYDSFLGMMAQGECGDLNEKMLGGIPAVGSTKGEINMWNKIGLRISRN